MDPRDPYDQISRALLKFKPKVILPWLMSRFTKITGQRVDRWEDSRRLARAGINRIDDLVAVLQNVLDASHSYLIVEVVTEPTWNTIFEVGVYEMFLGRDVASEFPDRMVLPIRSVVLGLTGETKTKELKLGFSGGSQGSRISAFRADLSSYKLNRLFDDVAADRENNILLAFAPLCRLSGESQNAVARWRELADANRIKKRKR